MARKDRSRKEVLWYVCQFHLGRQWGKPEWTPNRVPHVGSLIALQSMRERDFYLGWVHAVAIGQNEFVTVYTVESLETGELIDWSNVSILECSRETTDKHPEWRWTDEQWAFKDRWDKLCYSERDAYIVLPIMPEFDGDAVTLGTRIRHGWWDRPPSKRFEQWSEVSDDDMLAYFDASVAFNDTRRSSATV